MVQLSTPRGWPLTGELAPWGAFCQITLTSCFYPVERMPWRRKNFTVMNNNFVQLRFVNKDCRLDHSDEQTCMSEMPWTVCSSLPLTRSTLKVPPGRVSLRGSLPAWWSWWRLSSPAVRASVLSGENPISFGSAPSSAIVDTRPPSTHYKILLLLLFDIYCYY